jgi:ice-binding like protein
MSNHLDFTRGRVALAGIAVCFVLAVFLVVIPIAAKAAPVGLATAQPFVVLGGAGVTNTGPSVLNGDLGVTPGTSLSGFGAPAVVNGATHDNDAVAAQAQADLTTAYNVAAEQPIAPGNDLTGVDLGGLTLSPGAYGFSTSAQLTGQLTLDAHGDPSAQFVFVIGSTLTTASASSVILTNGASPCNVFWKVGSSATFGSGTAFEGNVLALTSISLNSGVTVLGRALARNGEVTLINDVLTLPGCATETSTTPTETTTTPTGTATEGAGTTTSTVANGGAGKPVGKKPGKGKSGKAPAAKAGGGTATLVHGKSAAGVQASVHGKRINTVTFTNNGVRVGGPGGRSVHLGMTPGVHRIVAHVTFNGGTKPKTLTFSYRVATPVLHPKFGPSQFTG